MRIFANCAETCRGETFTEPVPVSSGYRGSCYPGSGSFGLGPLRVTNLHLSFSKSDKKTFKFCNLERIVKALFVQI